MTIKTEASLREKAHEFRGILADMSTVSIESAKPNASSIPATRVSYLGLLALKKIGERANYRYDRKVPDWPFRSTSTPVIGWGQEKIAYRVSPEDSVSDVVISVYHWQSLIKDPLEVINQKRENYNKYRNYFGDLVVPTEFMVIDNPWGKGGKPATIQPYLDLERAKKLGDYTPNQLRDRAAEDQTFAEGMCSLKEGYDRMTQDGLCPDFGGGNVVVLGSDIRIFDTGVVESVDRMAKLKTQYPVYSLVESFNDSLATK